jgi:hypothetical protein
MERRQMKKLNVVSGLLVVMMLLGALILLASGIMNANEKEVRFRRVPWGCTIEDIKRGELGELLVEHPTMLIYKDWVDGSEVVCTFGIVNHRFMWGGYAFLDIHSNKNFFIGDFYSRDNLLREKYGPPREHEVIWLNDLYKDDPNNWGLAVSMGHLQMSSEWKIGKVSILHILFSDDGEIDHLIKYTHDGMEKIEGSLL